MFKFVLVLSSTTTTEVRTISRSKQRRSNKSQKLSETFRSFEKMYKRLGNRNNENYSLLSSFYRKQDERKQDDTEHLFLKSSWRSYSINDETSSKENCTNFSDRFNFCPIFQSTRAINDNRIRNTVRNFHEIRRSWKAEKRAD